MKSSSVLTAAMAVLTLSTLSACDGLKEAMTAHVDTVARAGSQELSVERVATLLSTIKAPPRKDLASTIANTWVDYQLLGQAAADNDTTMNEKDVDAALWGQVANIKAQKFYTAVSANWGKPDPTFAEQMYDKGDALAASHILILTKGKSDAEKVAAKRKADALRGQVNSSNFADLASKNSEDPGSAKQGGSLGLFRKGQMVPAFEQAVVALKPGEISPVIETEYGYHIIRRSTFAEVQTQLLQISGQRSKQVAESTFVANLQKGGELELKSGAAAGARAVIGDPDGHLDDGTTLATSKAGKFTAGRLAQWLQIMPPQMVAQQKMQLAAAPDSVLVNFVKNFVTNDLVLRAADSAKAGPTPQELADMHKTFAQARVTTLMQLGLDPKTIADSTKNGGKADREAYAARHVEQYVDGLVKGTAAYVEVPQPLSRLLRDNSKVTVNQAGLDRAVERASKSRATTDSTRRAGQPSSAVPIPAGPNAASNGGAGAPPPPPQH